MQLTDGNIAPSATPAPAGKAKLWWRLLLYAVPIVILSAAAIPNFVRAQVHPCKNSCINNLRQIDGAKEQLTLEAKLMPGDPVTAEQIGNYLKGGVVPTCPGDGTITIGPIGAAPTCSSREGHLILPLQN